jgi:hypothetical protein
VLVRSETYVETGVHSLPEAYDSVTSYTPLILSLEYNQVIFITSFLEGGHVFLHVSWVQTTATATATATTIIIIIIIII